MRRNLWTIILCVVLLASPVLDAQSQAEGGNDLILAAGAVISPVSRHCSPTRLT